MSANGRTRVTLKRVGAGEPGADFDEVAIEEPLEIRLAFDEGDRRIEKSISITMRTPGHDFELACGFLFTESILASCDQIESIHHCGPAVEPHGLRNVVKLEMKPGVVIDYRRLERHFYTSSSCGVCGKTSIEALRVAPSFALQERVRTIAPPVIHSLPDRLRRAQEVFESTGGLHAAGLFDLDGELVALHEDVGRHNALDKVIGREFLAGRLPLTDRILMLSGRASFELIQKAVVAGCGVVAAVGAPSSLAIELARTHGQTLFGFVRDGRFNVYSGDSRLDVDDR